jgi:hypothetical protein
MRFDSISAVSRALAEKVEVATRSPFVARTRSRLPKKSRIAPEPTGDPSW